MRPTAAYPLLGAALAVLACEGAPARSKPWRHAEIGIAEASDSPVAKLVERERERADTLKNRETTLYIQMDGSPRRLNPFYRPNEWDRRIAMDTIYEPLIRYRPPAGGAGSGPGRLEPAVLSSWTVSPDGRELRLVVGKGQRFHDGRRVTAVDVQFTLDMARFPRGRADHVRSMLRDITAVELLGPRVVRVRLSKPGGYLLRALAELPVLSSDVYQGQLSKRGVPVIGSGPYRLAERTDDRIVLERWAEYHGKAPAIERVVFVAEPNGAVALTAAKRGELDIIPALIPAHFPSQARAPQVQSNFEPLRLSPPTLRYAVLNLEDEPLDDHRVRRAIAHLVDRDTIATKVHRGLALPAPGLVWPGGPADGAAPAPPTFDPKLAADLLDRAAWKADGSGVRRRSGERLKLDVLVTDADSEERDLVLKSLRRAGIATEVRVGSPAVLKIRLRDGEFDLAFISAAHAVDRDLRPWLSTGGRKNWGGYSSAIVDRLLDSMAMRQEPAERSKLAGQLAAQLARDYPIIPLVRPSPYGIVAKRVKGLVPWNGWFSIRDLSLAPDDR